MAKHYMRHPDDIISATRSLTLEQRGVYSDLIDLYIARDGDLPDDDQRRVRDLACDMRVYRRIKGELIAVGKVEIAGGMIVPTGGRSTLEACLSKSEMARNAARSRWEKRGIAPLEKADLGDSYAVAKPELSDSESFATDLIHGRIKKPAMRTHKKRICHPEPEKKERKKGADASHQFAFTGTVIRLTSDDLERWRVAFHNVPNIEADLTSYDDYLVNEGLTNGDKWFHRTSAWLQKKDGEYADKAASGERIPAI